MANVTIKQVEGGQSTFPALDDAIELQTSANASKWAYLSDLPSALRLPMGTIHNAYISPTVSSNNLVVTLTGMNQALSATKPAVFHSYTGGIKRVTSALSVTVSAGTNTFNAGGAELATKEIDLFVYLGYNATDGVVIAVSRVPYATQYSDFSTTATSDRYAAISTTTNAAATDTYYVIGRFAATLSAGAGYTWSVPTFTPSNLIQHPIWETRWLTWAPVLTGFSANPTDTSYLYRIGGRKVDASFSQGTAGTSNATGFTATLPITPVTSANTFWTFAITGMDNNALLATPAKLTISSGTLAATLYKDMANAAWTGSSGKRALFAAWYEI